MSLRLPDARYFQIAALGSLLSINLGIVDFGAQLLPSLVAISCSFLTQVVCSRVSGLPNADLKSPLITGLSLSLLLRADGAWLYGIAAIIAISSKFLLRINGKHIFNPAGLSIVALLLITDRVWISPGQWGTEIWLSALIGLFAICVLGTARRGDIALFFLGSHAALLLARAFWLSDPLSIPLHQLQSGSLLIFAFFMISDPRTSPDSLAGRLLFAFAVSLLAHYTAFFMQIRPALYFALIILSPATFVIDRIFPARRFTWPGAIHQGDSQ